MSSSFCRQAAKNGRARLLLGSWCVGLILLLMGCGPGVGGTGTGSETPDGLSDVKTTAVCASGLASALDCPTSTPGAAAAVDGTTAVQFRGDGNASPISTGAAATVQGNHIQLQLPCLSLSFNGLWGERGGDSPRFHGLVDSPAYQGAGQLRVDVSVSGAGTALVAELWSAQGQWLAGPIHLVRSTADNAAPTAGQCP